MLQSLVQLSLRYRGTVLILAGVLLAYGLHIASQAKLDVFPNFVQPQVAVQTECPGLAPEQVETLVTRPLETMIIGLTDLASLRSESIPGLSIIDVVFKEGADVFRARQLLGEALAEIAGRLPTEVKTPRMTPLTSSTMDLLKIGLVAEQMSPQHLRSLADWTLRPRLLSVPGVAKCSVFGGEVRQWQIQVLPDQLWSRGLALSDVLNAARAAHGVRGAGYIETGGQRITIQTEGQATTPAVLGGVVVAATNGVVVRLRDVAKVTEGAEPKFGDCLIMGKPGVLLTMSSQYGANTMEVTRQLESVLAEWKPSLERQGVQLYPRLHRPATFIETALGNMKHSLLLGGVLVAIVLFLLQGSARTAFISLVAIPISLLTAVLIMAGCGVTINTITLGGLAIALGEVVDDSIIDVENILRRLRLNQAQAEPRSVVHVVLAASLEVRRAVVYATFVVALIFLPVLTLTGIQGSFFAPLALSYLLAILASLVVALTLTPALTCVLFRRGVREHREPFLQRLMKTGYERSLRAVTRWPALVMGAALLLCLAAATRLPFLGGGFLPDFREGHFVLQASAAPGTSLPEMVRIGKGLAAALLGHPGIATVEQQIGRAELGEDPWGPHRSEFHVDLKPMPGAEEAHMAEAIRDILKGFPGLQCEVLTFLGDRIGETLTGETAPVVVNVFGEDLDLLDRVAREVAAVLKAVPGAEDVKVKSPPGAPRLAVQLRFDQLSRLGFRPLEILEQVETALQGSVVTQVHQDNQVLDVVVVLDPASRRDPEAVGSLLLRNAAGQWVPLSQLADIQMSGGRYSISHEGSRRRQTVTCAVGNGDVASVVAAAKAQVTAKGSWPAGIYLEWGGSAEAGAQARRELFIHSGLAAIGILLLLTLAFRHLRNLLLVLANIPFALVGGVLAVVLTTSAGEGGMIPLSIGALVGFVTLFGITTRNSLMLISHYEHLVVQEGVLWCAETAWRGARERFMPILMTATVTGLGLLPLALGRNEAGREIEGPMAVVILGGLVTSTVLNLLVLPTLALRFGRFGKDSTDAAGSAGDKP